MKVLITGAAGYIGTSLCLKLLKRGIEVIGIDSLMYGQGSILFPLMAYKCFQFHHIDIRNKDYLRLLVDEADVVVHLAAVVGAPACDKDPGEAYWTNLVATRELVDMLDGQLLIFPNTNSGYGRSGSEPCTEKSPIRPLSTYAHSKCEAEKVCLQYPHTVCFRLATVYGISPRMRLDLMVNNFAHELLTKGELQIFDGEARRNFIHISDVVRAIHWTISRQGEGLKGEVFNLGDDAANMTKMELAAKIASLIGGDVSRGNGDDPDRRDYLVSSEKIYSRGYEIGMSLDQGLLDLTRGLEIMGRGSPLWRNV